ncbi:MAG: 50S ribosomal protein L25/general stress protein Ctc [Prevotellaceae bacterium]|jgi:large subunit ribosomal protein L25|nr:50S ribosomal protein L25/general stress protein Ctc [Prevotellaceae bacterium]
MNTFALNGTARTVGKKADIKAMRRNQQVPCVLYGNNTENIHFSVDEKDLKNLLYTPNTYIVEIDIDGKTHPSVMREVQFHPLTEKALHIDFYAIDETKPLAVDIPIIFTGNSVGVRAGGRLNILTRKLKVQALPKDLPDTLPVDISELGLGKNIVAGALSFEKLTIITPKTTIICAVKTTRAATADAAAAASAAAEAEKKK